MSRGSVLSLLGDLQTAGNPSTGLYSGSRKQRRGILLVDSLCEKSVRPADPQLKGIATHVASLKQSWSHLTLARDKRPWLTWNRPASAWLSLLERGWGWEEVPNWGR